MKVKKEIWCVFAVCLLLAAVFLWIAAGHRGKKTVFSEDYITAEELAPLLSFTYYSTEEWEQQISKIAKGKLSYRELEELLEFMNIREYLEYEAGEGYEKVSRPDFFRIYEQITDILDVDQRVTAEELVFISGKSTDGRWMTQKGRRKAAEALQYIHTNDMFLVYSVDGMIAGAERRLDTAVTWENIFVHDITDGEAKILFEKELLTVDIPNLNEPIQDTVCDLVWKEGAVQAIYKKEETIRGTVLAYDEKQIEIEGYGQLPYDGELKIYKTYGTVEQLDESKLMIGNLMADFVVAKGTVCGMILKEPARIQKIRVLLLNGEAPFYSEITISSDDEMCISWQEETQRYPANTGIRASDYFADGGEGYLKAETASETGTLYLTDEEGVKTSLNYLGSFEIRKKEEGYFIVNELSLEDYLCSVVPSEMPASYETEALRAQAVCARSYACIQLTNQKYAGFGANVDDSTNFQVYNKQVGDEKSTLAVRDTVGEVIKYNGSIAEAYYFSTSCGFSQNPDVWNQPANASNGYLESVSLLKEETLSDLSGEDVFTEFIKSSGYEAYDSDTPYFRWTAELDLSSNQEKIMDILKERITANPEFIQMFDHQGRLSEADPGSMGNILSIAPEERSAGGVLKKVRFSCEKGTILVTTEYNIRKILGAAVVSVKDRENQELTPMALLPSAAFVAETQGEDLLLYGGGYGHGIGMSQNGANGMAKAGYTYTEILKKFYPDVILENIYNTPGESDTMQTE